MNKISKNAYSSPSSVLTTNNIEVKYVGLWVRFFATIVDSIWQMPLVFAFGFLVYGTEYMDSNTMFKGPFDAFIQFVFPMLLIIGFWFLKSATPGKMVFKAVIVNAEDFGPAKKSQLIIRYLAYYVSILALGFGFLWVGIDKKKQGFHDKIAKTVVIYR